jgi:hypothetical protein
MMLPGFEVAMDDAPGVSERHCFTNSFKEAQAVGERVVLPLEVLVKARAFDEFHHVVEAAVRQFTAIVDGDDIRMFERSQHARFPPHRWVLHVEHLEGDGTVEFAVVREVDGAHSPAAQFPDQGIAGEAQVRQSGGLS